MSSDGLIAPLRCPDSWRLVRLKDISKKIGSGATPTGGQAAYQEKRTNYAFVRSQNVYDRTFSEAGLAFISDEQAEGLRNVRLEKNDLLLNITGDGITFGRACLVPGAVLPACVNQHVSIVRLDPQRANPGYILSYLTHPVVKDYIEAFNAGGSRRAITKAHIESFVVPLPPLAVQNEIVATLGALDDRIALLRETNATLEAIAQALFKSWFVDFDPAHANRALSSAEGLDEATPARPTPVGAPGVPPDPSAVAALFPDSFEESELGLVPRGWRVGTLQDLLVLQRGFDLPASDRIPGAYPLIAASGPSGSHCVPMAKGPGVVTGRSGVLGRVFLELEDHWPLNTTLWVKEFREATPCYAYELLSRLDLASFNAGSAVPTLNRNHVHSLKCLIPAPDCMKAFEAIAVDLHKRARANQQQAQTLATLRDTLLPRLISGQLRLPEVEATFEESHS